MAARKSMTRKKHSVQELSPVKTEIGLEKTTNADKIIELGTLFLLGVAPLIFFRTGGEFENTPKQAFLQWGIGILALFQILRIREGRVFFWRRTPFDIPVISFYVFCWISLLQAFNPWQATMSLLHWGICIIFYFFLVHTLKKEETILNMFFTIALSVIPVSIIGILQTFSSRIPKILQEFIGNIPQMTIPSSTFSNSNMVALFLAITFPLSIGSLCLAKRPWIKLVSAASILSGGLFMICTKTRGAWLAIIAVAVILLWYKFFWQKGIFRKLRYILGFSFLLTAISIVPILKIKTLDIGTLKLRLIWWTNTAFMIKENPLMGVGLGNFKLVYPLYHQTVKDKNYFPKIDLPLLAIDLTFLRKDWSFTEATQLTRAHNDHLQMLAELGLFGFCAYASMFLVLIYMFRKTFNQGNDRIRLMALCTALSVLAFCIVATTNFPFERALPPLYLFMCFAFISFLYKKQPPSIVLPGSTFGQRFKAVIVSPRDIEITNKTLHRLLRTGLCILLIVFIWYSGKYIRKVVLADKYFVDALTVNDSPDPGNSTTGRRDEKKQADELLKESNNRLIKAKEMFSEWNFNITALLARNYTIQGQYQMAIDEYQASLRVHPNNVNAILNTGYCYLKLGNYDQAENYFKKFLNIMTDSYKGYNNLGIVYYSKKDYDNAIKTYKKACELNPSYAEPHFNLGNVYRAQGNIKEAMAEYEQAIQLKPELTDVRDMLANLYIETGDLAKAEETIAPLANRKETAVEACMVLGNIYQSKALYEKALFQYLKAVQLAPREAIIYHNIGLMHYMLKNYDKAEKSFEIAIEVNPNFVDSYSLLAQMHLRRQDDAGALDLFLKALQINPRLKDIQFNVGTIYLRLGNLDAAVHAYNEALKIDPEFSAVHYNLATILRHQGKKEEALLHFEKALQNPSDIIDVQMAKKFIAELKRQTGAKTGSMQ